MSITINDLNVIEMEFTIPICGRAVGSFSINTNDIASYTIGTVITLKNEDASYEMFISEFTGNFLHTTRFKAYGGKKDIIKKIDPKSWNSSIPLSDPIKYVLQQVGLSLSDTSSQTILNKRLDGWNIIKDDGDIVLKNILNSIPDSVIWQILPDGSVYIGEPKYSTAPNSVYYNIQDEHPELGSYSGSVIGLGLQPGMTIELQNGTTNITNIEYHLFDGEIVMNIIGA